MTVKLNQIEGLMLERKTDTLHSLNLEYNKALHEQGQAEIELDIEETAKVLYGNWTNDIDYPWETLEEEDKSHWRILAKELAANLPRLLRAKKP